MSRTINGPPAAAKWGVRPVGLRHHAAWHSGAVSIDPVAEGARRAEHLVRLLAEEERVAADALLADLDVRDLVFTGAAITAAARAEGRRLPPAQRAQASTRQVRLALLRDANRTNPDGLRSWLVRAGEELLFVRALVVRTS